MVRADLQSKEGIDFLIFDVICEPKAGERAKELGRCVFDSRCQVETVIMTLMRVVLSVWTEWYRC